MFRTHSILLAIWISGPLIAADSPDLLKVQLHRGQSVEIDMAPIRAKLLEIRKDALVNLQRLGADARRRGNSSEFTRLATQAAAIASGDQIVWPPIEFPMKPGAWGTITITKPKQLLDDSLFGEVVWQEESLVGDGNKARRVSAERRKKVLVFGKPDFVRISPYTEIEHVYVVSVDGPEAVLAALPGADELLLPATSVPSGFKNTVKALGLDGKNAEEESAKKHFEAAKTMLAKGELTSARTRLQRVIDRYPQTETAKKCADLLEKNPEK
jgi:hypothetical protein